MKKIFLLLFISITFHFGHLLANSTNMPQKYKVEEQVLVLNGKGVRHKWVDLYTAGLYLPSKTSDANKIVNGDETMIIKIDVISKLITSSRLEEAMRSEINRVTAGKIEPYKERIEQLVGAFKEEIKKGDVFDLIYTPESGLLIYKNGKPKTSIKGVDFKKVIFMTWLGNDPADQDLKDGMLGKDS